MPGPEGTLEALSPGQDRQATNLGRAHRLTVPDLGLVS